MTKHSFNLQTYRDYHADIYPETNGYLAAMGPDDWWKSKCNNPVPKIDLDPKKRPKTNLVHFNTKDLSDRDTSIKLDTSLTLKTSHNGVEEPKRISGLNAVKPDADKVQLHLATNYDQLKTRY